MTAALVLSAGADAWAQDGPKIMIKASSQKEVRTIEDGREVVKRLPVDGVKPGEVLVYTAAYTNTGKGEAKNASIVNPIPEGTDYILGSAEGDGTVITCSIDGGKSYQSEPCMQEVEMPDGTKKKIEAEPRMYTHIRWVVSTIPPDGSGEVSFKVKVEE